MFAVDCYWVTMCWQEMNTTSERKIAAERIYDGFGFPVVLLNVPMVLVRGELWRACSLDGAIDKGEGVDVVSQEGLSLEVRRSSGQGGCGERER